MINLNELNDNQRLAVTTMGNIRIIAGAGSGKTKVLTTRIAYLIEEKHVNPYNILAITFTNKAAKEMRDRVSMMIDQSSKPMIATFHSLCARILREDINKLGYPQNYVIVDSEDQKALIKKILKQMNISGETIKAKTVLYFISNMKNNMPVVKDHLYDLKLELFEAYNKELKRNQSLDFDDLQLKVLELFRRFPLILEKWQHRYHYIHVDEFQDTNQIQFELVNYLSAIHQNVCVVGDPDQTIYSWRGADISIILDFEKYFKNATTITLNENYRSTPEILNVANKLIVNNKYRLHKDLITNKASGIDVEISGYTNNDMESKMVVKKIEDLSHAGVSYNDIAILYRINATSRIFEQALINKSIPYQIYGSVNFFERKEIKDMLAYLRMLENHDDLAFLRTINMPKRGVGPKKLSEIEQVARLHDVSLYEAIRDFNQDCGFKKVMAGKVNEYIKTIETIKKLDCSISEKLKMLLDHTNYMSEFDQEDSVDQARIENIEELITSIEQYQLLAENPSLSDYLQEISLYSEYNQNETQESVKLMTVHSAKGLEFEHVFVVSLNDGSFPLTRAIEEGEIEEERRLAYVAFTRARQALYLSFVRQNFKFEYVSQSVFVKEITEFKSNVIEPVKKAIKQENKTNYQVGEKINHITFKEGIIVGINKDVLDIAFPFPHGIKKISATFKGISKIKAS